MKTISDRLSQICEIEYPDGIRIRLSEPVRVSFLIQLARAREL